MATREDYLSPDEIASGVDFNWCNTDFKEIKLCYLWTIKKFSCLQEETGDQLESSTFSSREDDGNKWCLRLYPRGFGRDDWGCKKFIGRDYLMNKENKLLPNDELKILCQVVYTAQVNSVSDVILVADSKEVHAHKNILSLSSPVFTAMFENDMEEKKRNRVDITDIEYRVLEAMIRFIYTRQVPSLDDKLATQLLIAADKYALEELKSICEQSLSLNLTPEKVVELIPLTSLYNANHLKTKLIEYLMLNAVDFDMGSLWLNAVDFDMGSLWDILIIHNPNLAIEAFRNNTASK